MPLREQTYTAIRREIRFTRKSRAAWFLEGARYLRETNMGKQIEWTGPSHDFNGGNAIMEGCLAASRIERSNRQHDHAMARAQERELTALMKRQPRQVRETLLMAQYALLLTDPVKANAHLSVAFASGPDSPVCAERSSAVL
jgi:hypothetical protein